MATAHQEGAAWCVLRTAGRSTLSLAETLTRAGYDVWTPASVMPLRLPRAKGKVERAIPIMPTFVFARARHLSDLIRLSDVPNKTHEGFSVFRYFGRIPLIADAELEALRSAENRAVPKKRQRVYRPGESVRVPEGSFGGMTGVVEDSNRRFTFVCFGGSVRVKISTFLLRPDEICRSQPATGAAALAA